MKKIINGIIVVEGTTDVAFLSEFIEAEFVSTNGSDVPQSTIDYLKKSREKRDIFVLTDPDSPGKKIRDILDQQIPNLKHCFISKECSIKNMLTRPEPFVPRVTGMTVRIATGTAVPSAARYGPCVWFHPYVARPNLFHVFVSVIGVP